MKLRYDPFARAAYLKLRDGIAAETEEIAPDVLIDVDAEGHLIGIEFLDPERDFDSLPPTIEVVVNQEPPRSLAEWKKQSAG